MEPPPSFSEDDARRIGEAIGIDWRGSSFDIEQFRMGLEVELEHGRRDAATNVSDDDELTTGKIAWAHLNEFPDYYTRLARMEAEGEDLDFVGLAVRDRQLDDVALLRLHDLLGRESPLHRRRR